MMEGVEWEDILISSPDDLMNDVWVDVKEVREV